MIPLPEEPIPEKIVPETPRKHKVRPAPPEFIYPNFEEEDNDEADSR